MVIDGLDHPEVAAELKSLLPQDCGQMLITTENRAVLEHFLPLNREELCFHVDYLEMEDCQSIFRWHITDNLVAEGNAYLDDLLGKLSLPMSIIMLAKYLTKYHIPALDMYNDMSAGNGQRVRTAVSAFYDGLFSPLISSSSNATRFEGKLEEWPSEELKLLGELSCLSNDEMELRLIEQTYESHPQFPEMLGTLANCSLIGRGERGTYYMREFVQRAVRDWIEKRMGIMGLVKLHETALTMLSLLYGKERDEHALESNKIRRPSYLWKLRFMPHFECFLDFVRERGDRLERLINYYVSDRMAKSVITFSHVYLEEGRYDDAIFVLRFTHEHYKERKYHYQLGRNLIKAYLFWSLGRKSQHNLQEAEKLLNELVKESEKEKEVEQRWWLILELANFYSKSKRPKLALQRLKGLRETQLSTQNGVPSLIRQSNMGLEDDKVQRLVILLKIEEAKAHFASAKVLNSQGHSENAEKELERAETYFNDARLAISKWLPGETQWVMEVDDEIADVLFEIGTQERLGKACDIHLTRLRAIEAENKAVDRSWSEKGLWNINCKIARIWIRMRQDHLRCGAIQLLKQLLEWHRERYGENHGDTRTCAYLLKDAYERDGQYAAAGDIDKQYCLNDDSHSVVLETDTAENNIMGLSIWLLGILISLSVCLVHWSGCFRI